MQGMSSRAKKNNSDLFLLICRLIRDKGITFHVYWMPSHLDDDENQEKQRSLPVPDWVIEHHIFGNGHADRLAKFASRKYDIPVDAAKPINSSVKDCGRIQRRLAAIICHLPYRPVGPRVIKPPKAPTLSLAQRIQRSCHIFQNDSSQHLSCVNCLGTCSVSHDRLADFLAGVCRPREISKDARHLVSGPISMNGRTTHKSHTLACIENEYFCTTCGLYARSRVVKLVLPCVGSRGRKAHGNLTLKSVDQGFPPSKRRAG